MAAEQIPTSGPEILLHGGWVTTAVIGALAWLARVTIGRNLKAVDDKLDKLDERLDKMADKMAEQSAHRSDVIASVDARLARLEGRFERQDHAR